jgi:hypothetical protein
MKKLSRYLLVIASLAIIIPQQLNAQPDPLIPPDSLSGIAPDDAAILSWYPPSDSCCPPSGQLPEGILGYNIYKNQEFLAYTPHIPPGVYTQQGFVEEGITPGWYEYTVTAVYDLASYGQPGDTAESIPAGPAVICCGYCFELEFVETWDAGIFEDNFWIAEGENWTVSSTIGHPAPSAQFGWYPVQDTYFLPLESNCISTVGMTEGKIWLDFDLKLNTPSPPSGSETMKVQVWNWDNESWSTVAVYNNEYGSFDWTSQHLNITSEVMNSIFKVRFVAEGHHSSGLISWNIDNIRNYRTCGAPHGLYSVAHPLGVELYWETPDARDLVWYNIYRSYNGYGYELLAFAMGMPYLARWEGPEGDLLCFKVTAEYQSNTDICESDYSNEDCFAVGIESPKAEAGLNIYPNPAMDHLVINPGRSISDKEISVSLYNSSGSLLQSEYRMNDNGEEIIINLEKFPSGIYWIMISRNNQIDRSAKFIISR